MSAKNPPKLLAYADRLSARSGDTIAFKVSSFLKEPFTAKLTRSISADPNPAGPGIVEEDASAFFDTQSFDSLIQPFYPGSYAVAQREVAITNPKKLTLRATVFPTLRTSTTQTILSIGNIVLSLNAEGAVSFSLGDSTVAVDVPLPLRRWAVLEVEVNMGTVRLRHTPISADAGERVEKQASCLTPESVVAAPVVAAKILNGVALQHFNGKIEAPAILVDGNDLAVWDFSQDISSTVGRATIGPDLDLINFPTRATTGSNWDGSEMNWTHGPDQYAAIHFHDDDIYDFGWATDFTFTVPNNMPSGIYVMRLECDGYYDAIPFFICMPKGTRSAKLCVLVSTFTYAIYGNHARPDHKPTWQQRIDEWGAYPYNPASYSEYGLSTYNYHSDGSGICHASYRRPLFNLRPGYLTFGEASCSGLRHFQADSHLISWLHAKDIDYDIITDEELHYEGVEAIAQYSAVTTGTHPEYHTEQTLNALRDYRDAGGHLNYLGGNGFYWRIAIHKENKSMLEIRRAEDGIRAWAAEPGEYYNAFDAQYGGLWRRNGRAPQQLVGIGFAAQGEFFGDPYARACSDEKYAWVFKGLSDDVFGNYGFSGNGAAGFELDRMDYHIGTPTNTVLLARSVTRENGFMLVPEEQLTHLTNLSGGSEQASKHADMIYIEAPGGGSVFSTGSITFCGSLPWNSYDNDISRLLENVISRAIR